jgi:nitronate monooxygenase
MPFDPSELEIPLVGAPMAGGPSTPELAVAVSEAGGLGFLAAGYKSPDALSAEIASVRAASPRPFGVNIFALPGEAAHDDAIADYADRLKAEADGYGVVLGEPRHDDDAYAAKLAVVMRERVRVVSFTFGCPESETVAALKAAGSSVWVTVTDVREGELALAAGADALVAQGAEAGGHRGFFDDDDDHDNLGLLVLLRLLATHCPLPTIAAGGIMDGPGIAAVLCGGAVAAQLGTALMLTPEAGTSTAQREVLAAPAPTRLTRAFSGRSARGIVNRFMSEHDDHAPAGYPEVHHLTTPIRAAARGADDPSAINLWAGQSHELVRAAPAQELVRSLAGEARDVLTGVAGRWASRAAPQSG